MRMRDRIALARERVVARGDASRAQAALIGARTQAQADAAEWQLEAANHRLEAAGGIVHDREAGE
jgi:hypothetical protein